MRIKAMEKYSDIIECYNPMFGSYIIIVNKKGKEVLDWLEKDNKETFKANYLNGGLDKLIDHTGDGAFIYYETDEIVFRGICLNEYSDEWKVYELLLHEIVHFKQKIWETSAIGAEEKEFESYFIESTFRVVRGKLWERYNKFLKKQKARKTKAKK